MTPRAATGTFPYPHRTVAEVWASEDAARLSFKGPFAAERRADEITDGRSGSSKLLQRQIETGQVFSVAMLHWQARHGVLA